MSRSARALGIQVSTRLVGLALSYTLQLSGMMQWAVRQTAEAENEIVSVERILDYSKLPQEAPTVAEGGAAQPTCAFPCAFYIVNFISERHTI